MNNKQESFSKVIIIEDSESVSSLYVKLLSNIMNYEVNPVIIDNIQTLDEMISDIEYFIKNKVALIISEAELNNVDITDKIQTIKNSIPTLNVCIISNRITLSRVIKALKCGVMDWIEKPIVPEEFYSIVENSIFKGHSYDKRVQKIEEELSGTKDFSDVEFHLMENKIAKLISDNPSRYEGHYLLGKLYSISGNKVLAEKHYKASEALK